MAEEKELGVEQPAKGEFFKSLTRNNKSIKEDRATTILEDAEMTYKRTIEDMEREQRTLERKRANMLDLSPTNTFTLMLAEDFDSRKFTDEDLKIAYELKILGEKISLAKQRYEHLFGKTS